MRPTLLFVVLSVAACSVERGVAPRNPTTPTPAATFDVTVEKDGPIVLVDGKRLPMGEVQKINSETIASVEVIKGQAALTAYGPEAAKGVIVITTKKAVQK